MEKFLWIAAKEMIDRTSYHFVPVESARRMPEFAGTDFNIQRKTLCAPLAELCMPAVSAGCLIFREGCTCTLLMSRIARFDAPTFLQEQETKHDST